MIFHKFYLDENSENPTTLQYIYNNNPDYIYHKYVSRNTPSDDTFTINQKRFDKKLVTINGKYHKWKSVLYISNINNIHHDALYFYEKSGKYYLHRSDITDNLLSFEGALQFKCDNCYIVARFYLYTSKQIQSDCINFYLDSIYEKTWYIDMGVGKNKLLCINIPCEDFIINDILT